MKIGEVEKNIKIPGRVYKGQWIDLANKLKEVGDSVLIEIEKDDNLEVKTIRARITASMRPSRTNIKITTKKISETKLRIWRTK